MASRALDIKLIGGTFFPFGSKRYLRQLMPYGRLRPLAPKILASVTPSWHHVRFAELGEDKPDRSCDIVGISFTTAGAQRAYQLADRYRELGVTTIAGGVHPTLMTVDTLKHFDSVAVGPGETIWPQILSDFQLGRLEKQYLGSQPDNIPSIKGRGRIFRSFHTDTIEITRGCPNFCGDFCCVPYYYGLKRYIVRPVEDVIAQMETLGPVIMLYDNNLVANLEYAKQLFEQMAHLNKKWIGAATLKTFVENPWLAKVLSESGCLLLFIGLESLVNDNMNGNVKSVKEYETGIQILHDAGIGVEASFIIGLPHDDEKSLEMVPRFVLKNQIEYASLNIATPFPGTGFYNRMKREGRIITTDWSLYDTEHVVFRPENMAPEKLEELYELMFREIFSMSSIARRSLASVRNSAIVAAVNLLTRASFEIGR